MADISGRRDRNKKSPSVHYDMHRCTRGCDLHCFVAERNVDIGKCDYMGTGESVSTYMCMYIHICIDVCICIPNHIERRSTWKPSSTDITGHRYYNRKDFGPGLYSKSYNTYRSTFCIFARKLQRGLSSVVHKNIEDKKIILLIFAIFILKTCYYLSLPT